MRVLSVDIGIRHLGLCLLMTEEPPSSSSLLAAPPAPSPKILNWANVSLFDERLPPPNCSCCTNTAKWMAAGTPYCTRHLKSKKIQPPADLIPDQLKQKSREELEQIAASLRPAVPAAAQPIASPSASQLVVAPPIAAPQKRPTKAALLKELLALSKSLGVRKIPAPKKQTLTTQAITERTVRAVREFCAPGAPELVLIEQQMKGVMKMIQGTIAGAYLMQDIPVHYVSACGKLQDHDTAKSTYGDRKKSSTDIAHDLVTEQFPEWRDVFARWQSEDRADDPADALLQALAWLARHPPKLLGK